MIKFDGKRVEISISWTDRQTERCTAKNKMSPYPDEEHIHVVEKSVNKFFNHMYVFLVRVGRHIVFCCASFSLSVCPSQAPHGLLSGECVGLMTWWLRVRSPVEVIFLSGVFSPLTSAEACEKK